jgi:hypothetical protein
MQKDNSKFDDVFGNVLKKNLKQYVEPKHAGFREHVLRQVELLEEQKLLQKVVWQGRLVLSGCAAICVAFFFLAVIYPELIDSILTWPGRLFDIVISIGAEIEAYWQVCVICLAAVGLVAYNLVQVRLTQS